MKKMFCFIAVLSMFGLCNVTAQSDAEMKAWQNYMTPGDVHKMLAEGTGNWTEDITMWSDPNAAPTKSTSTTNVEMIMGGRYQVAKTKGEMMGMPFEGMSVIGYDNAKKVFTSSWVDNFGTGTMTLTGTWDAATKSITFLGKSTDPMTGKDIGVKQVMKFIDSDHQEMTMFDTKDGKETKSMEIKSTRKK